MTSRCRSGTGLMARRCRSGSALMVVRWVLVAAGRMAVGGRPCGRHWWRLRQHWWRLDRRLRGGAECS